MEKQSKRLCALCCLVYFCSYLTRHNYAVVVAEITAAEGISKALAGSVVTGGFIAYGISQLISGWLGDRLEPWKVVFGGLAMTAVCNLLLPLCPASTVLPALIWLINGFAQAMIWPPMVKIMSSRMDAASYQRSCVQVSIFGSVGTVTLYLLAPLCIAVLNWKSLFFLCGFIAIGTALLWKKDMKNGPSILEPVVNRGPLQSKERLRIPLGPVTALLLGMGIVTQGVLRDGVTTWMPSLVSERYGIATDQAILTAVLLPVTGIFAIKLVGWLFDRHFATEIPFALMLFCISEILCLLLAFDSGHLGAWGSVGVTALVVGSMHGINLLFTCLMPARFKPYGNVAFVTGLINSLTYVGSALSTFGFAAIAEASGWGMVIRLWCMISAVGAVICLMTIKPWKHFIGLKPLQ